MTKKLINRAEAIKLINDGAIVKNDTSDGHVEIKKKPKGIYETRVYTIGNPKTEIMNGNFSNLLKLMNSFDDYYIEE